MKNKLQNKYNAVQVTKYISNVTDIMQNELQNLSNVTDIMQNKLQYISNVTDIMQNNKIYKQLQNI